MALMAQLRAAYFLLISFVAFSLTGYFLYTQDFQARDEEYTSVDQLLQWRDRLQRLEIASIHPSARSDPNTAIHVQKAAHALNGIAGHPSPDGRDTYDSANMVVQEQKAWVQSEYTAYDYAEDSDTGDKADSAKSADVFGDKGRILLSVHNERDNSISEQALAVPQTAGNSRDHNTGNYYSNDNATHHKLNFFRYIGRRHRKISASQSKYEFTTPSLPRCSSVVKNRHHSDDISTYAVEVNAVFKNLETCVASANLTNYFSDNNIRVAAMTNAANLLYMLRLVVPTKPLGKFEIPCWKGELEMQLCQSSRGKMVEGSVHGTSFLTSSQYLQPQTKWALKYAFGSSIKSQNICLPKVFIAGFPKCGSSYLYCLVTKLAGMAHHTYEVSELEKEPHFWVSRGPSSHHLYPPQIFDLASYLFNFLPTAKSQRADHYSLPIDGSPNLMFQWPRYSGGEKLENYCLVPAVLPQILPHSKYIVIMRNPADMLYSAFWFSCSSFDLNLTEEQQQEGPFLFHEKVIQKINIFRNCSQSNPLEKCMVDIYPPIGRMFQISRYECGRVRLEVGFYYLYIQRWLSIVPREQFLFLTAEEMHSNVVKVASDLSNFLELGLHISSSTALKVEGTSNSTHTISCKNVQKRYDYRHNPSLQMLDMTRNILNDFFETYNKRLANLLQDKKFLWKS